MFVTSFSPFYAQEQIAPVALFLRAMWAICSPCSFQKSDREQIVPVALYKRATLSDSLFFKSESLFPSFAHKKHSKPKSEFPPLVYRVY